MLNLDGEEITEENQKEEKTKITPFSFVEAINYSKDLSLYNEDTSKQYIPFIINKALSFFPDTVILANEMNKRPNLDKDMQFSFLAETIRKRKRYGGWIKKVESANIETIKTFYKYSTAKAMNVADLLSDAELSVMKQKMSTGGTDARPHKPKK